MDQARVILTNVGGSCPTQRACGDRQEGQFPSLLSQDDPTLALGHCSSWCSGPLMQSERHRRLPSSPACTQQAMGTRPPDHQFLCLVSSCCIFANSVGSVSLQSPDPHRSPRGGSVPCILQLRVAAWPSQLPTCLPLQSTSAQPARLSTWLEPPSASLKDPWEGPGPSRNREPSPLQTLSSTTPTKSFLPHEAIHSEVQGIRTWIFGALLLSLANCNIRSPDTWLCSALDLDWIKSSPGTGEAHLDTGATAWQSGTGISPC